MTYKSGLPSYTTVYVPSKEAIGLNISSVPAVGTQCPNPNCGGGFIESGKWESVICTSCRYAYKKSKFDHGVDARPPRDGSENGTKTGENDARSGPECSETRYQIIENTVADLSEKVRVQGMALVQHIKKDKNASNNNT